MTETQLTASRDASVQDCRLRFGGVLRSEWTKLRSLRSTWLSLALSAVITLGIAAAAGASMASSVRGGHPLEHGPAESVDTAMIGVGIAALVLGVLGALQMAGEYGTGMIRASLTAVPTRLPVLAAKALILLLVTLLSGVVLCLGCYLISQAFLSGLPGHASLADHDVLRAIAGNAVSLCAIALIGLGLAAILRNTAGTITVLVAALYVLPSLVGLFPKSFDQHVSRYLPSAASASVANAVPDADRLSAAAGGFVLAGYVLLVIAIGAFFLRRRDA